jgi:phosphohistidine phosphatase SixA
MKGRAIALTGSATLWVSLSAIALTGQVAQSNSKEATWKLLQQRTPGIVVLMRHAEAPGTGDPANFQLGNCATQRNLSAVGRSQAANLGRMFRDRAIPIVKIFSSQWCRCLDTARLLNLGTVESLPALNSFFRNPGKELEQTATVRQWIRNNYNQTGITILVTHQVNITALTQVFPRSGELILVQATRNGSIKVIGRI